MINKRKIIAGGILITTGLIIYYKFRKTIPAGIKAVKPFNISKYLGKWYEIARLDFYFEKNLDYVTADYSFNKDGSIKVVNRGFNYKKQRMEESIGKAFFVGNKKEGKLKVSFGGPFYSGYNIISIDKSYKYALVAGHNRHYLWILSKEKQIPDNILRTFLYEAKSAGFDTSRLVWSHYK